jgi:hypothetical protein
MGGVDELLRHHRIRRRRLQTAFDVTGNLIGPMQKVERVPEATLGRKQGDTQLTGLLKNELIHVEA